VSIVFSFIELCIFLCRLVLFVSTLADRLAGKTILSWYLSCQKSFPYKDQIEKLFIVMVYCMYSQHIVLSTFSLISLFNCNIFIKGMIYPICAESVVKPQFNRSINQFSIFPLCNVFDFLINFKFLNCNILLKAQYSLFCAKSAIKSKGINQ